MSLQFERGNRTAPVGHALVYFRADTGAVLGAYISVPPIKFNPANYLPGIFAGMMQGMDMEGAMAVIPTPPVPEEVQSVEYLQALAERRHDDLLYGGMVVVSNPMQLMEMTSTLAREYAQTYEEYLHTATVTVPREEPSEQSHYEDLGQSDQLKELTMLTGRLQDSLAAGADPEVEGNMHRLASLLPAKYRVEDLIEAAHVPGERGRRLAGLYLERCYKLFNEDYLDLERIDREIAALQQ